MEISKSDIDELLKKWYETKQEISLLEAKCEKYKKYADKIMKDTNNTIISNSYYTLQRKEMSRSSVSKKNMPSELWNKYCTKSTFNTYNLTKKLK
jgi:hypothetical protein